MNGIKWLIPLLFSASSLSQDINIDFETGDLSQANLSQSGDGDWQINAINQTDNRYNLQSPALGAGQSAALILRDVFVERRIEYTMAMSTERGDRLEVYVDGEMIFSQSGGIEQARNYSFYIDQGYHEIKWQFIKDMTLSDGQDAIWLDNIAVGVAEDVDADGDGIIDFLDNCPLVANPNQLNSDDSNDGGDACDLDDDNDGIRDELDAYPLDPLRYGDSDGDGIDDFTDTDDDNDGVDDTDDAFPLDASEQIDTDNDSRGNNKDLDDDGDGMPDEWELAQQFDPLDNRDGLTDADNDSFSNEWEYYFNTNPHQADDSVGDEGQFAWQLDDFGPYKYQSVAADGSIYFAGNGLLKLSPDGEVQWHRRFYYAVEQRPIIGNDGLIYVASNDWVYALSSDGIIQWQTSIESSQKMRMDLNGHLVYLKQDKVNVVNALGGLVSSFDKPAYSSTLLGIGKDNEFYFTFYDYDYDTGIYRYYLRVTNNNGDTLWQYQLPADSGGFREGFSQAQDGTVYISAFQSAYTNGVASLTHLYAIKVVNNEPQLQWHHTHTARSGASYNDKGAVIGENGVIYLDGLDHNYYALNADDGSVHFVVPTLSSNNSSAVLGADGSAYFISNQTDIVAIDRLGQLKWRLRDVSSIYSSLLIDKQGRLLTTDKDGKIKVIETNSGSLLGLGWPTLGFDASGGVSFDKDTDNDGMPDSYEIRNKLPIDDASHADSDSDNDGSTDLQEFVAGSDPTSSVSKPTLVDGFNWFLSSYINNSDIRIGINHYLYLPRNSGFNRYDVNGFNQGFFSQHNDIFDNDKVTLNAANITYVATHTGVVAVREDLSELWNWQSNDETETFNGGEVSIDKDGYLYVHSHAGILYKLSDKADVVWQRDIGAKGRIVISTDGVVYVYVHDADGLGMVALDSAGQQVWRFNLQSEVVAGVILDDDGSLYFSDINGQVYALDDSGASKWSYQLNSPIRVSGVIGNQGQIYFATTGGLMAAFDKQGNLLWSFDAGEQINSAPAVDANGVVYVATSTHLYGFNSDGALVLSIDNITTQNLADLVIDGAGNLYILGQRGLISFDTGSGGVGTSSWPISRQNFLGTSSVGINIQDVDNDGIADDLDNCPHTPNPKQHDADQDFIGDACDDDADNDGVINEQDVFPLDAFEFKDTDGDGIGDNSDKDDDNDSLGDAWELAQGLDPLVYNDPYADTNNDGLTMRQAFLNDLSIHQPHTGSKRGLIKWRFDGGKVERFVSDLAGNTYQAIAKDHTNKLLVALDNHGYAKWQVDYQGTMMLGPLVNSAGQIVFATGQNRNQTLYAYSAQGDVLWQRGLMNEPQRMVGNHLGDVIITSSNGNLLSIDSQGEVVFEQKNVYQYGALLVVAADNSIYQLSRDNKVYVTSAAGDLGLIHGLNTYSNTSQSFTGKYSGEFIFAHSTGMTALDTKAVEQFSVVLRTGHYQTFQPLSDSDGFLYRLIEDGNDVRHISKVTSTGSHAGVIEDAGFDTTIALDNLGGIAYFDNKLQLHVADKQGQKRWTRYIGLQPEGNLLLDNQGDVLFTTQNGSSFAIFNDATSAATQSWAMQGANAQGTHSMAKSGNDYDYDGDGINNDVDNCPMMSNPDQTNTDGANDGGDACDVDDDNDGVNDAEDHMPLDANEQFDVDGDGIGDNRDTDDDNDGINDEDDLFPLDANEWADFDLDGIGNNEDTDDDNDGLPDLWELSFGLDVFNADDATIDSDGDGYTNIEEYSVQTSPTDSRQAPGQAGVLRWRLSLDNIDYSHSTSNYHKRAIAIGEDELLYFINDSNQVVMVEPDGNLKVKLRVSWSLDTSNVVIGQQNQVYAGDSYGTFYEFDRSMNQRWRYSYDSDFDYVKAGVDSTGNVIATAEKSLVAITPTGERAWEYVLDATLGSFVAIDSEDNSHFYSSDGFLNKVNNEGELVWRINIAELEGMFRGYQVMMTLGVNGEIYVHSFYNGLYAFDRDGNALWNYQSSNYFSSAITSGVNGDLYVAMQGGKLVNLSGAGELIWSTLPPESAHGQSNILEPAAVVADNGMVYKLNTFNQLLAYYPDGRIAWQYDVQTNVVSELTMGSDGTLYFIEGINDNYDHGFVSAINTDSSRLATSFWPTLSGSSRLQSRSLIDSRSDDYDGDGINNSDDNCPLVANALQINSDGLQGGNACDWDDDNDGIPDYWEIKFGLSSIDALDASIDADGDGASNLTEYQHDTNPNDSSSLPDFETGSLLLEQTNELEIRNDLVSFESMHYGVSENGTLFVLDSEGQLTGSYPPSESMLVYYAPVINDEGYVVFSARTQSEYYVIAVDSQGNEVWRYSTGQKQPHALSVALNGNIYVNLYGYSLLVLDGQGQLQWEIELPLSLSIPVHHGVDGTAYVQTDDGLQAINSEGQWLWTHHGSNHNRSSYLSISNDGSIYLPESGRLTKLSASGKILWHNENISGRYSYAKIAPVIDDKGYVYVEVRGVVYKYSSAGVELWRKALGDEILQIILLNNQQLLVHADDEVVGLSDEGEVLFTAITEDLYRSHLSLLTDDRYLIVGNASEGARYLVYQRHSSGLLDGYWPMRGQNPRGTFTASKVHLLADADGDGIANDQDNCIWHFNPNQLDFDGDGATRGGDICDIDDDNDGVLDGDDAFPLNADEWIDTDGDNVGNNSDADDDGDGVNDSDDAFALDANEWLDTDGDGIGNNEDTDDDNDGMEDEWELDNGLNTLVDDAQGDADGDGYSNLSEMLAHSDPNDASIYPGTVGTLAWRYVVGDEGYINNLTLSPTGDMYVEERISYNNRRRHSISANGRLNWTLDDSGFSMQVIGDTGTTYGTNTDGYMSAMNSAGEVLWTHEQRTGYSNSALSSEQKLYLEYSGRFFAYDAQGQLQWQYDFPNYSFHNFVLDSDDSIYTRRYDSDLGEVVIEALNTDGTLRWQYQSADSSSNESSIVLNSLGQVIFHDRNGIVKLLSREGQLLATFEEDYSSTDEILVDSKDRVYLISKGYNSSVRALNADLSLRWTKQDIEIESILLDKNDFIYALVKGNVYGQSALKVFDENGVMVWSKAFETLQFNEKMTMGQHGLLYFYHGNEVVAIHTQSQGMGLAGWPSADQNMQQTRAINRLTQLGDKDGDGVTDLLDNCPWVVNTNQANFDGQDDGGDACDNDDDNDGMPDYWETEYGLNTLHALDAQLDNDGDGDSNVLEYQFGTNPTDVLDVVESPYGEKVWESSLYNGNDNLMVLDDEANVYISCDWGKVCRYDSQGELIWKREFNSTVLSQSVIDNNGNLLVVTEQTVEAITPNNELQWRFESPVANSGSRPVVSEQGMIYLLNTKGQLIGLNHQGQSQWQLTLAGSTPFEPVIRQNGEVVIVSQRGFDDNLWLTRVAPNGDVEQDISLNIAGQLAVPLAISAYDNVYLTTRSTFFKDAILLKISAQGVVQWRRSLEHSVQSNIVIDVSEKIYYVNNNHELFSLDSQGDISFMKGRTGRLSSLVLGQRMGDADDKQVLFYANDQVGLIAVDSLGRQIWQSTDTGNRMGQMLISNQNTLIMKSSYNRLAAIHVNTSGVAVNGWAGFGGNGLSQGRIDFTLLDSDNDGIYDDFDNCINDYNPDQLNTDGANDGGNACDSDDDNDGVNDDDDAFPLDAGETIDSDGDGIGNNTDNDDDNDGMSDSWEIANGLDSLDASDAAMDSDGDGYTNLEEYRANSDPNNAESVPNTLGLEALGAIIQLLVDDDESNKKPSEKPSKKVVEKAPLPPLPMH